VVVPEEVKAGTHRGQDLADLRLPGVPSHPQPILPWARAFRPGHLHKGPVGYVMKVRREITRGDGVEVVVVAVDPVDRSAERFVTSLFVGDVADAEPERNLGMERDDRPGGVERAVDVA
jgi:hypothetical protein